MKKISFYMLTAIVMLSMISCNKYFSDSDEGGADIVFKYKNENYANYVGVVYSEKKNKVVGYPDSSEVFSMSLVPATKCSNG